MGNRHKENRIDHKEGSENSYSCEECGKIFHSITYLRQHQRKKLKAAGERNILCTMCPKGFPSSESLKCHQKNVHEEKMYKCEECDKRFVSLSKLKSHYASHRKPFQCDICFKAFTTRDYAEKHRQNHRNRERFTDDDNSHISTFSEGEE